MGQSDKKQLKIFDLHVLRFLMSDQHKSYINKKEDIIKNIDEILNARFMDPAYRHLKA